MGGGGGMGTSNPAHITFENEYNLIFFSGKGTINII